MRDAIGIYLGAAFHVCGGAYTSYQACPYSIAYEVSHAYQAYHIKGHSDFE
jgi:hypothetical protein